MRSTIFLLFLLAASIAHGQDLLKTSLKIKSPSAMAFSQDNKYLVVASGKELQLFNSGSDTKALEFSGQFGNIKMGHTKEILSIACSTDNSIFATGSMDGSIKFWKIPNGNLTATIEGDRAILDLRFVDNNKYIAAIKDDMTLSLWEVADSKLIYSKKDHSKALRAMDVSFDGKWIATGGADKEIILWNAISGEIIKRWVAHDNWIRTLAFSPDSKTLASGGDDKKIILWDISTGKAIKQFDERGWIHELKFSNDGKYLAGALEKNAVHVYDVQTGLMGLELNGFQNPVLALTFSPSGKELATIEEFASSIKYWNVESLNISPVFRLRDKKDISPPQIFVSNPPNLQGEKVKYSKDLIDITGSVMDESGVRRLRINGIETPIKNNGNFIINLPLSMGDNFVNIEATDVNDNIALKKFVVSRQDLLGGDYDPSSAKNFLLVVGINKYEYWPQLNNAVKDANDLAGTLMGMYNFDFSNVTVLRDEQATRNLIYKTLRGYIEQVTPKDNLVIYFSGHGHFDELLSEGYWVPVEAHLNAEGEYLPNSSILKIIENINSQHTFLIADACFSGSLFGEQKRGFAENVEKYRSRWGLASGRLETVSDGAQGTNSPFATELLTYLRKNTKEKITVSEIIQSVKLAVSDRAEQTPIGNPLKVTGDEGGEFVFYKRN